MASDKKTVFDLIRDIRVAMMTTLADGGTLRSRPMWTTQAKPSGPELWFFTHDSSNVAAEIKKNSSINLAFSSPEKDRYISLAATAEITRDLDKAKEMWREEFQQWFPGGVTDPDLTLIKVTPARTEYWDADSKKMVQL